MSSENMIFDSKYIFLITGIMASGKSTVAQLLAERFQKGVHVRGDIFRRMVVAGREEMTTDENPEAIRQLTTRYKLAAMTADEYFDAGFTVVVQDNIFGQALTDFTAMIHSRPLFIVVLCPRQDVVAKREAERPKKGYGEWSVASLDHILRTETPKIGLWIDSSEQTPEETVDEILVKAWTEARIS